MEKRLSLLIFSALSAIVLTGCTKAATALDDELLGRLSRENIPVDKMEALARLRDVVPIAANKDFKQCKDGRQTGRCRDFILYFKIPFQRQISNEWMRPSNSALAGYYRSIGEENPEMMAADLVDSYAESARVAE